MVNSLPGTDSELIKLHNLGVLIQSGPCLEKEKIAFDILGIREQLLSS